MINLKTFIIILLNQILLLLLFNKADRDKLPFISHDVSETISMIVLPLIYIPILAWTLQKTMSITTSSFTLWIISSLISLVLSIIYINIPNGPHAPQALPAFFNIPLFGIGALIYHFTK